MKYALIFSFRTLFSLSLSLSLVYIISHVTLMGLYGFFGLEALPLCEFVAHHPCAAAISPTTNCTPFKFVTVISNYSVGTPLFFSFTFFCTPCNVVIICKISYFQSCTFSNYLFIYLNILMISSIRMVKWRWTATTHARASHQSLNRVCIHTSAWASQNARSLQVINMHTYVKNCPFKGVNCIYQNQLFKEVHFKFYKWGWIDKISECRRCN